MIRTAADTSTAAQQLARAEDLEFRADRLDELAKMYTATLKAEARAAAFRAEAKALREKVDG